MHRDFDYVTMDDYKSDMDEQTKLGAGIIAKLKKDCDDYKYRLWLILNANGGALSFSENDVCNNSPHDCEIELSWSPSDNKFTLTATSLADPSTARRRAQAQAPRQGQ